MIPSLCCLVVFFFQAEDGIRDFHVTGVQTCALPIFELLLGYEWPGNIRQLQNVMERLFALSRGPVIPEALVKQALPLDTAPRMRSFNDARRDFERQYLTQLLAVTKGNMTQAAELADRNRSDLHKLVKRHAINPGAFRSRGEGGG